MMFLAQFAILGECNAVNRIPGTNKQVPYLFVYSSLYALFGKKQSVSPIL